MWRQVALILLGVLLVVSFFIISNAIKMATINRAEEIAIMKIVGATNAFVRWPFVVEGIVLGLTSAIIAGLLQFGIYSLLVKAVSGFSYVQLITLLPLPAAGPSGVSGLPGHQVAGRCVWQFDYHSKVPARMMAQREKIGREEQPVGNVTYGENKKKKSGWDYWRKAVSAVAALMALLFLVPLVMELVQYAGAVTVDEISSLCAQQEELENKRAISNLSWTI